MFHYSMQISNVSVWTFLGFIHRCHTTIGQLPFKNLNSDHDCNDKMVSFKAINSDDQNQFNLLILFNLFSLKAHSNKLLDPQY